jgi:YebC/PmpR family DNA-binding regulatory protein
VSGHSKWSQIKRKKSITDAKRGAAFTKLIREITVAARNGGGDPNFNPRLRLAVDTAKAANMPADNIDRAIKKGTGELEGVHYEEIAYEGYGPAGVAFFIDVVTDNANRTVSELRYVLSRNAGTLGTTGSVAWQFERLGQIYIDAQRYDEDSTLEAALDAGASDMVSEDGAYVVSTDLPSFHAVQQGLKKHGIEFDHAEVAMVPKATVKVTAHDTHKVVRLLEALEELEDVQRVYSNADLDEAALAEAEA